MALPTASDTLNPSLHYRREVFQEGLKRLGYAVGHGPKANPEPHDVLLIWNRGLLNDSHAKRYEAVGARVLVTENGYFGKDRSGHQFFALALGHHLGAGAWEEGSEDRWAPLNVKLAPWRSAGREIVVLPQRGIGEPGVAMPRDWPAKIVGRLKQVTDRPIRVRPHPGKARTDPYDDLRGAWAAVTWASGAGIKSLICGIPVFHEMPTWIGGPASRLGIDDLENPFLGDRLPMFRRLAWSQWSVDEIRSGEPFRRLLK